MGVFYFWQQGPDPGVEYALGSDLHRYNLKKCGISPRIATTGFVVKSAVETEPETVLHKYFFEQCSDMVPKKCIALNDVATGKRWFLYVSDGKLAMAATSGKTERNRLIFDDRATGKKYRLYVSKGKLTMETIAENVEADSFVFDDHRSGDKYVLYVSAGKLAMDAM